MGGGGKVVQSANYLEKKALLAGFVFPYFVPSLPDCCAIKTASSEIRRLSLDFLGSFLPATQKVNKAIEYSIINGRRECS